MIKYRLYACKQLWTHVERLSSYHEKNQSLTAELHNVSRLEEWRHPTDDSERVTPGPMNKTLTKEYLKLWSLPLSMDTAVYFQPPSYLMYTDDKITTNVSCLYISCLIDKDVFGFQITVNNVERVKILECQDDLTGVECCLWLATATQIGSLNVRKHYQDALLRDCHWWNISHILNDFLHYSQKVWNKEEVDVIWYLRTNWSLVLWIQICPSSFSCVKTVTPVDTTINWFCLLAAPVWDISSLQFVLQRFRTVYHRRVLTSPVWKYLSLVSILTFWSSTECLLFLL